MAASHPNAAISDTFGDASDAVMPTSAFVMPAASRTNAPQMKRSQLLALFPRASSVRNRGIAVVATVGVGGNA